VKRLAAGLLSASTVVIALVGCSSAAHKVSANEGVTVSGPVGKTPVVHIPARAASGELVTKTLAPGHGAVLASTDSYLANFSIYLWHGSAHRLLYSTYTATPQVLPVTLGISGVERAMAGQRAGGRVLAVVPPKDGYGSAGNPQAGVGPGDTLVWVIDPIETFAKTASASGSHVSNGGGRLPAVSAQPGLMPTVTIPKTAPPAGLKVLTLIKGAGPAVRAGQVLVVKYVGVIWRSKQIFDENWPSAARPNAVPAVLTLGQEIAGWNTGLVGVPVGSRVMLVIPPAEGYGKKGNPQAGIQGTDTLVFVVDVLATA
jgi:FKBP-type peptidyl-prolyl cis-trans isomerase